MRNRSRRRARRATLVAMIAVGLLALGRLVAFPDEHQTKPGAAPKPEDSSSEREGGGRTVPAATTPAHGIGCARGWSFFDNPALHYGLCLPEGWGLSDLERAGRLTDVPAAHLADLRILSGDAFPWTPGVRPFDAIVRDGIRMIELTLLEPGAVASTECEPDRAERVGAFTFRSCEQAYDPLGEPASIGVMRAIKVVVPLVRAPEWLPGPPDAGARLLVVARYPSGAPSEEVNALWRIVRSIRPW